MNKQTIVSVIAFHASIDVIAISRKFYCAIFLRTAEKIPISCNRIDSAFAIHVIHSDKKLIQLFWSPRFKSYIKFLFMSLRLSGMSFIYAKNKILQHFNIINIPPNISKHKR